MTEQKQEVKPEKKARPMEESFETLVRIYGQDIKGSKNLYVGLTKIKGISWAVANAICLHLKLNKQMRIKDVSKEQIAAIEKELHTLNLPVFLRNRRDDHEGGGDRHILANDLDVQKEFDIKRLKKMKSYKGIRHSLGQPVRGQRTRSHFRTKGGAKVKKKNATKT